MGSIKLADNFWDYKETCEAIKKQGIFPDEHPSDNMMRRLRAIVDRCMAHYVPLPGDYTLKGVYLYRASRQTSDLRDTYGYTQDVYNHEALIGLSYELLEYSDMRAFHDTVFIHELAHLTVWPHDEGFQNRFNDLIFDYHFYNKVRTDARDRRKINRHGWKM